MDDVDFADDLALLFHTQQKMQEKTTIIATHSACLGLTIHKVKSKILKVNNNNMTPIRLEGEGLEELDSFTYLGSADVTVWIGKAREAFQQLRKVWGSSELPRNTKIFNSIMVKPVLLYGAETWRTTVTTMKKNPVFYQHLSQTIPKSMLAEHCCGSEEEEILRRVEMAWPYPSQACIQHCKTRPLLEFTGREAGQETAGAVTWMQM